MQTAMQRSRVYATPAVQRKLRGTRGSSQLVKASERVHVPDTTNLDEGKAETVSNLVSKKEQSGKSFTQIANEVCHLPLTTLDRLSKMGTFYM